MIIFDDGLGRLGPMTDLRASFEVRTGMLTTAGRLAAQRSESLAGYWVPRRLEAVVAERANVPVNRLPVGDVLCCVNGRWGLPDPGLKLDAGQAARERDSGQVVAAMLQRADAEQFLTTGELPDRVQAHTLGLGLLYEYPWDVLAGLARTIAIDIESVRLVEAKVPGERAVVIGQHPVELHDSATLHPNVVLDAERGPIVVHERAIARPGAVLCGPCSIGRDATIADHALIKPHTVIGPGCRVGGEVGGTIFQGHSNKVHDGHLGDSWVGEWINFGAGTTNSNLLNTYGEVNMRLEVDGPRHRTGQVFLGAVVGDHVKFAINTRIMTGAVVGTGAMIATTAPPPTTVRRFAWLTDRGEQVFRFEKFLETAGAVMARRQKAPSEAYVAALRELHGRRD
ncbi:MAG: putative sugar nucleotidyl transferase [Planctomycetota bacterium]|jgi:UDP-N-acetylglucosamine diphosphorylase/glucosamine-1-phosphate N-acetyltransferase